MNEFSNDQILREAPNLVEYGIRNGLIRKPTDKIEHLKDYFGIRKPKRRRQTFSDSFTRNIY